MFKRIANGETTVKDAWVMFGMIILMFILGCIAGSLVIPT